MDLVRHQAGRANYPSQDVGDEGTPGFSRQRPIPATQTRAKRIPPETDQNYQRPSPLNSYDQFTKGLETHVEVGLTEKIVAAKAN